MTDERKDKMSGSGMKGYADCAGKYQLEKTCPEGESSIYAEIGNRIHQFLAGDKTIVLSSEEDEIAKRCLDQYDQILGVVDLGQPKHTIQEERLWYGDQWSGQIDLINFFGENDSTALVVDWKTGRNAQSSASENLQLRAYAVLVKKEFPQLKRIIVAIVQPMAAPYTLCEYDEADLAAADEQIQGIVSAALAPNAPRTPSPDACKYCRAKNICPEAQAEVTSMVEVKGEIIPQLTNDQVADFLEKAEIVEAFIESLREEAKKRLQNGAEIAGRKLTAGRTSRSIEDHQEAFNRVSAVIGENQYISACKVSVPSLEKVFAASTGLKPKEAKAKLEELLGDVLVSKTGEPIMARAK